MASIGDLAAALRRVLATLDAVTQQLQLAGQLLDEASAAWHQAADGSASYEAEEIGQLWQHATGRPAEIANRVAAARNQVRSYLDTVEGGSPPASAAPNPAAPPSRREVHERYADVIRSVHRRVGAGVRGAQTRGAWVRHDGTTEDVRSGHDTEWHGRTKQALAEVGGQKLALSLSAHVEMQLVTRMMVEGRMHETLALDRAPCGTQPPVQLYQCHRRLPAVIKRLLPPGATLTVVSADGQRWRYSQHGRERL